MAVSGYVRMTSSFGLQRMGQLTIYSLRLISIHICQFSFSTGHISIDTQDRRSRLCRHLGITAEVSEKASQ